MVLCPNNKMLFPLRFTHCPPSSHTPLPPRPPYGPSGPSSVPLTQERPSVCFLPPPGGWDPSRALRRLQGPAPSSWGLAHHTHVSSPSSGKTSWKVRPTSGAGRGQPRCLWRGNGGNTDNNEAPLNPRVCPPGTAPALGPPARLGAELGRQKLLTNQATAPTQGSLHEKGTKCGKLNPDMATCAY